MKTVPLGQRKRNCECKALDALALGKIVSYHSDTSLPPCQMCRLDRCPGSYLCL